MATAASSGIVTAENAAVDIQQVGLFARLASTAGDVSASSGQWADSSLSFVAAEDSEPVAAAMHHRWITLLCCLQGRPGSAEVYLPGSDALPPAVPSPSGQSGQLKPAAERAPVQLLSWNGRSFEQQSDLQSTLPASDGTLELPAPPCVVAESFPVTAAHGSAAASASPVDFFDKQLQGLLLNPLDASSHHSGVPTPFVRTQGGVPVWAGRTTLDGAILSVIRDCIVLSKVALPRQHQGSSTPPVRMQSGFDEVDIPTPPRLVKSTSASSTALPPASHATRESSFPRSDISYPVLARKLDFVHLPVLKRALELVLSRRLGSPAETARGVTPPGEAAPAGSAHSGSQTAKLDAVALVTLIGSYPFLQLTLDDAATTVSNIVEEARRLTRASASSAAPHRTEAATSARERRRARKRLGLPPALQRRIAVRFAGWLRNAHKYKSKMSRFSRAGDSPADSRVSEDSSLAGKGWRHPFAMSLTDLLLPAEVSQPLVAAALGATAGKHNQGGHVEVSAPADGVIESFGSAVQAADHTAAGAAAPMPGAACWRWQLLRERLASLLSSAPQGVLSGSMLLTCYGNVWGQSLAPGSFGYPSLLRLLRAADDLFVVQTWQSAATSDPDLCSELMRGTTDATAAPSIPDDFSVAVITATRPLVGASAAALQHATCSCAAQFAPWLLPTAAGVGAADSALTSSLLDGGTPEGEDAQAPRELYASLSSASLSREPDANTVQCRNYAAFSKPGPPSDAQRKSSVSGQAEAEGLVQAGQLENIPPAVVHEWCVYLWGMYQCICKLGGTHSSDAAGAPEQQLVPEHGVTAAQLRFKTVRQALNDAGLGPPSLAPVLFGGGSTACVPYSKLRLAFVGIMQSIPWAHIGSDPETKGRVISVPHMPLGVRSGSEVEPLEQLSAEDAAVVKSWVAAVASTCAAAASSQQLKPEADSTHSAAVPSGQEQLPVDMSPKLPGGVTLSQVARAKQVVAAQLQKLAGEQTQAFAAHTAASSGAGAAASPSSAALARAQHASKLGLQPADVPMHALGLLLKDNKALKATKMRLKTFIASHCGQFATLHLPSGATSTLYARLVGLPPPLPLTAQQSGLQQARSIPGLQRSRSAVDGQDIPSSPSTFLLGGGQRGGGVPGVPSQLGTASQLLLQAPAQKEDPPATAPVADASKARSDAIAAIRSMHAVLRRQLAAAWRQRLQLLQEAGVLGSSTASRHSPSTRALDQPESVTGPVDERGVPMAGFVPLTELGLRLLAQGIVLPAGTRLGTWLVQQSVPLEVATAGDGSMWVRVFDKSGSGALPERFKDSVMSTPAALACGLPPPRPDFTGSMVNTVYNRREHGAGADVGAGQAGSGVEGHGALPLADAWSRVLTQEQLPVRYYVHGCKIGFDEDAQNEFKEGLLGGADKAIPGIAPKYIVSFLNGAGGTLYFGVTDDGVVQGVYVNREQRDRINLARDTMMQNRIGPPGTWTQVAHPVFVPVFQMVPGAATGGNQYRAIPDTFVIQFHVQQSPNPAILHFEVKSAGTVASGGSAGRKGKHGVQGGVKYMYWVRHAASTRRMEAAAEIAAWAFARGQQHPAATPPAQSQGAAATVKPSVSGGIQVTPYPAPDRSPPLVGRGGGAGSRAASGGARTGKTQAEGTHSQPSSPIAVDFDPHYPQFQEVSVQLQSQESVQFSDGRGEKGGYGAMGASCVLTLRLGQTPIKPNGIAVVVAAVHGSSPISAIVKPGALLLKVNGSSVDGASVTQLKRRLAAGQVRRLLLFAPLPPQPPGAAKPAAARAPHSYAAAASSGSGGGGRAAGVVQPTELRDVDTFHAAVEEPPPAWKARIMGGGVGGVRHAPAASDEPSRLAQPMQRLAEATNHGNRVAWGASGVRRALARAVGRRPSDAAVEGGEAATDGPRRFAGMGYQKHP